MLSKYLTELKTALLLLLSLTLLIGILYPLLITLLAQIFFPWQANGSLIHREDKIIGSALIGQLFTTPEYFWGRPSATTPYPYNAALSSGSNLAPTNPDYLKIIADRVAMIKSSHPDNTNLIPADLVTASASGLDPDISPLAAYYQVSRIARARNVPEEVINQLIEAQIQNPAWFFLGEPRVNVLQLNIALNNNEKLPAH